MKPHRLAVYGLTAGLLGGGAAGVALGSAASTGTTLASARIADVTPAPSGGAAKAPDRDGWVTSALDPLVAKGTITKAQEDAVVAALKAARPDHGPGFGGHRGFGFRSLDGAAKALGLSTDDLRTALAGGKSLADVAKDKGVDPAKVTEALMAELKARLDSGVKEGHLTQAAADKILAEAKTRMSDFVNGKAPAGGPGGFGGPRGFGGPKDHGPGGRWHGGPGDPAGPGAEGANPGGGSTTTTS